jgi:hypothetical protein
MVFKQNNLLTIQLKENISDKKKQPDIFTNIFEVLKSLSTFDYIPRIPTFV